MMRKIKIKEKTTVSLNFTADYRFLQIVQKFYTDNENIRENPEFFEREMNYMLEVEASSTKKDQ